MITTNPAKPLSLYIHMPWCVRKCPYCDFNSHAVRGDIPEKQYIDQLISEYSLYSDALQDREITSIFIGGGTPSLISAEGYLRLFAALQRQSRWSDAIEITLEANPGTFEQQRFSAYRRAGINRLSIGIQSFNPQQLRTLGRIHDQEQANTAVSTARRAGFDNINLDIMYALPNQNVDQALQDLQQAIEHQPEHLSWYQLTLEPNTLFHHQPPKQLPDEGLMVDIEQAGRELLSQRGFVQYEVSAYTRTQQPCRHNVNYWQFGDYLGIGAGAHSKLSDQNKKTITRHSNVKHPKAYLRASDNFQQQNNTLDTADRIFEFMLNVLRLYQPISFTLFEQQTELKRSSILPTLQQAEEQGLITYDDQQLESTAKGKQYLNSIITMFLPD